jgi:hypothetical protein
MLGRLVLAIVISLLPWECSSVQPQPQPSASGWTEPAAYTFVFASTCGERAMLGQFRVQVEEGRPIGFEPIDATARAFRGPPSLMPTLAGLVSRVTDARSRGADRAHLTIDPTDGHPVSVLIDPARNTIDEEECYTITEYVPQPRS